MKRIIDIILSSIGLFFLSPIILICLFLIWVYDFNNPFYAQLRMGKNYKPFKMYKLRSMYKGADNSGVLSTSSNDNRITPIGKIIRKIKLDEISQLINVFIGNMSLVGPRPQVISHINNEYTNVEKELLIVKPGITDFSSIVFSDEAEILKNSLNPDLDYNQLIRPWKSRLGILYIRHQSILLDIKLILLTIISIISKEKALNGINKILLKFSVDKKLIEVAKRKNQLTPYPPPGSKSIVSLKD